MQRDNVTQKWNGEAKSWMRMRAWFRRWNGNAWDVKVVIDVIGTEM